MDADDVLEEWADELRLSDVMVDYLYNEVENICDRNNDFELEQLREEVSTMVCSMIVLNIEGTTAKMREIGRDRYIYCE